MTNFNICVLFLVVAVLSSPMLSQYIERDYTVKLERLELQDTDSGIIELIDYQVKKHNRTITIINISGSFKEDLPTNCMCSVDGFEKMKDGTYRQSTINVPQINCCSMVEDKNSMYQMILPYSNLPTKCPAKAGQYEVKGFIVDEDRLPDRVPGEFWRFDIKVTCGEKLHLFVKAFVEFAKKASDI